MRLRHHHLVINRVQLRIVVLVVLLVDLAAAAERNILLPIVLDAGLFDFLVSYAVQIVDVDIDLLDQPLQDDVLELLVESAHTLVLAKGIDLFQKVAVLPEDARVELLDKRPLGYPPQAVQVVVLPQVEGVHIQADAVLLDKLDGLEDAVFVQGWERGFRVLE